MKGRKWNLSWPGVFLSQLKTQKTYNLYKNINTAKKALTQSLIRSGTGKKGRVTFPWRWDHTSRLHAQCHATVPDLWTVSVGYRCVGSGQSIFLRGVQVSRRVAGQTGCALIVNWSEVSLTPKSNQLQYLEWKIDFLWHSNKFHPAAFFELTCCTFYHLFPGTSV